MNHVLMLLRYDWPAGPVFDAITFPLWPAYGYRAEDAQRRLLEILAGQSEVMVQDVEGEEWPVTTSTVRMLLVWRGAEGPRLV